MTVRWDDEMCMRDRLFAAGEGKNIAAEQVFDVQCLCGFRNTPFHLLLRAVSYTHLGIGDHFIKADAMLGVRAGNALVGVNLNKLPFGILSFFHTIPAIVTVHCIITSGNRCNLTDSDLLHLSFQSFHVFFS